MAPCPKSAPTSARRVRRARAGRRGRAVSRRPRPARRSPTSRPAASCRRTRLRVGLDDLGAERIVGQLHAPAAVVVFDLDRGEGHGLAVVLDDAAETVAGPQAVGSHERLDFDRQADQRIPTLLGAERPDDDLRVMNDVFPFGRLPIRGRLDEEDPVGRLVELEFRRVGRLAGQLRRRGVASSGRASRRPPTRRSAGRAHFHHRPVGHRVREADVERHGCLAGIGHDVARREDHLEVGIGRADQSGARSRRQGQRNGGERAFVKLPGAVVLLFAIL